MVQMVKPEPGWADYLGQGLGQAISGGFNAYHKVKTEQRLQGEAQLQAKREERLTQMAEQRQEMEKGQAMLNVLKLPPGKRTAALTYLAPSLGLDTKNPNTANLFKLIDQDDEATQKMVMGGISELVGEGQAGAFLQIAQADPVKAMELAVRYATGMNKQDKPVVLSQGGRLVSPSGETIAENPKPPEAPKAEKPAYLPAVEIDDPDNPGKRAKFYPNKNVGEPGVMVGDDGITRPYTPPAGKTGGGVLSTEPDLTVAEGTATSHYGRMVDAERSLTTFLRDNPDYLTSGTAWRDSIARQIGEKGAVVGGAIGTAVGGAGGAVAGSVFPGAGTAIGAGTGATIGGGLGAGAGALFGESLERFMKSDQGKEFEAASSPFVTAALRKDSGAAITNSEWERAYREWLPLPGDPPQVLAQKAKNRSAALAGAKTAAGPGARSVDASAAPPASTKWREGQTATNPKTGEKMRFNGGAWVPVP